MEDAAAVRRWAFALVGALLFGSASFFYGLIVFQNGLEGLTMQELAIWLIVVGLTVGALRGLVLAWVMAPSTRRWARFLVLGTVEGLLIGLVYGLHVDEACEAGYDGGGCGWPSFGLLLSAWLALGLWTITGGVLGGIVGVAAGVLTRRRHATPAIRVNS